METLKIFGERLRALRDERHLRQADMAEVLQITLVHYQRMEYGKVNVPSLTLCFLAITSASPRIICWGAATRGGKSVPCTREDHRPRRPDGMAAPGRV